MDVKTASPAEIDTRIADIHNKIMAEDWVLKYVRVIPA